MSVTVAAALKKVAAAVLTDKKAGKTVGSVVLAVILIAIFPIVGVTGALGSLGKADAAQLQAILAENLSGNEIEKLQTFEDTMRAIESAMAEAGFASQTREAQAIYALLLSNDADDSGMIEKLVGCFSAEQTDEQLLANVYAAFGTEIPSKDFVKIMQRVRAVYIDTSHYVDPSTKNNLDLVLGHCRGKGWMGLRLGRLRAGADGVCAGRENRTVPGRGRRPGGIHPHALAGTALRRLRRLHQGLRLAECGNAGD